MVQTNARRAWSKVHPDVLINAFRKAGFRKETTPEAVDIPTILPEDYADYAHIDEKLHEEELRYDELVTTQVIRCFNH